MHLERPSTPFTGQNLVERVLALCAARDIMIGTAESCTGGMVAAALTDIPGSSAVVERGVVTYSNAAKSELLGVPPELISEQGAVSEPVARAMAQGLLARAPIGVAIAVTGVAGPSGTAAKPEGMVWFGCAAEGLPTRTVLAQFGPIGRAAVRRASVDRGLLLALETLSGRSAEATHGA